MPALHQAPCRSRRTGRGTVLVSLFAFSFFLAHSAPIDQAVIDSVVQVLGPPRADGKVPAGTGFLIGVRNPEESGEVSAVFLVTNKHMLGSWNPADRVVSPINDWLALRAYKNNVTNNRPVEDVRILLKTPAGVLNPLLVALHPDQAVDVAIVRVDQALREHKNLNVTTLTVAHFEAFEDLPGPFAGTGSLVYALGYPNGVTSVATNRPVAKVGHLAAKAGEELTLKTTWSTRQGKNVEVLVRGKLLLIDGLLVPGNSGGPVILPGAGAIGTDPKTGLVTIKSAGSSKILGVVSAGLGPSGLAYAYSTDYINELIVAFFSQSRPRHYPPSGASPSNMGNHPTVSGVTPVAKSSNLRATRPAGDVGQWAERSIV